MGKHTIRLAAFELSGIIHPICTLTLGEPGVDTSVNHKTPVHDYSIFIRSSYCTSTPPSTPVADDVRCACAGRVHRITSMRASTYFCFSHLTQPVI